MKRACGLGQWARAATLLASAGCGASLGSVATGRSAPPPRESSIGALALAQGGLASLGGAGNREGASDGQREISGRLRAHRKERPLAIDGALADWPELTSAEERSGDDPTELSVGLQYDDERLYLAAEIDTSTIVRSAGHPLTDDHLSVTMAFPTQATHAGSLQSYEIALWPRGPAGRGVVRWASPHTPPRAPVEGASLAERSQKGVISLEATIPWSAFREADRVRVGLRANVRWHHGDSYVGLGTGDAGHPEELEDLLTSPEQAWFDDLLMAQGLQPKAPRIDVFANVAGDSRFERISVFGSFVTICGPGFRNGKQFFWRKVEGEVLAIEARKVAGRNKDDMVVRRRISMGSTAHEVREVWSLDASDEPITLFSDETPVSPESASGAP